MMNLKRLLIFFTILLAAYSAFADIDPWYHNNDEIREYIFNLQAQEPTRVKVDSIGYSTQEQLPIYVVKVSDDAQTDYDRPTLLFCGQVHAEELQGIELVLRAMTELATLPNREYRQRRNNLEVYFIPTLNPEGLNVIHGVGDDLVHGYDESYRKNKRDNVGDGLLRYHLVDVGGGDTSGVDINRNFPINWFAGDTLYTTRQHLELWDYYRGPYPASESEVQAAMRICEEIQPLFSQTFHTSRTGNFSEKVMFPWDWNLNSGVDGKACPDIDVVSDVAAGFALHLTASDGGHYEYAPSGGRNGKMHDWMYAQGGWINMQTELTGIQPDSARAVQIQDWTIDALYYLMDRAWDEGVGTSIKVIVKDAEGNPLKAEVFLPDYHNGYLQPRYTDPVFGVHRRPLLQNNYTVVVRKWGYAVDEQVVYVGNGFETAHNVTLQPLPTHRVAIGVYDASSESTIEAKVVRHRDWGIDTLEFNNGVVVESWPEGSYELEVFAEGYIPRSYSFDLDDDINIRAMLSQPTDSQIDDFEAEVPNNWVAGDGFTWGRSGREKHTGDVSLESYPYQQIQANGSGSITATYSIPDNIENLTLVGWCAYELEPDYDFCYVQIAFDDENIADADTIDILNGFSRWRPFFYDLHEHANASEVSIRWTISTDATDIDRGLFLDDVGILVSSDYVSVDEPVVLPSSWCLAAAYPNPFNPSTRINFEVGANSHVKMMVYDVLGREILNLLDSEMTPGQHSIQADLSDFASGLYFVRMEAPGFVQSQKIMLIK